MVDETIYDIYWEGEFELEGIENYAKDHHVLYQIYGNHHLYGRGVLLYIGMTLNGVKNRLDEHEEWLSDESDKVTIRLGSLGKFTTWKEWDKPGNYKKEKKSLVQKIESLLIYANQPVYNSASKNDAKLAKNLRLFNSGYYGKLLPESSYKYNLGE